MTRSRRDRVIVIYSQILALIIIIPLAWLLTYTYSTLLLVPEDSTQLVKIETQTINSKSMYTDDTLQTELTL